MRHNLGDSIAVVGLAGRFPAARDAEKYWLNLVEGREAVRFPADEELLAAGVPARLLTDSGYVKAFAETPDMEMFDAGFFGFTPREASLLDPQIRMFLEVAHAAVENAGYDPFAIAEGMGVFGTTGVNRYIDLHVRGAADLVPSSTSGLALSTLSYPDYLSTQLSYRFGFRGPSLTVSTACSSSALAVHLACQSLRVGECDVAIAGGTEAEMPAHHGYQWDPGGPMSADGHCRPFDTAASGTVFSTGAGAVLLKRLDDAIADGDHVRAVIRASAVNNDGRAKAGFSAPGIPGQVAVVREAMSLAGVDATDLSYVEAHATGTLLGDPIEVAALTQAYSVLGADRRTEPLPLSSVKGNVGHLGHASGIASLIKLSLCLENERRVGTVNFTEPNPRLRLDESPFVVSGESSTWARVAGAPRLAGMNSLGIGGTNVHLVVEEAPAPVRPALAVRPRVVLWSARTDAAARDYEPKLAEHLRHQGDEVFADTANTLQDGRTQHPVRAALVAATAGEAEEALLADRVVRADAVAPRSVVFAFSGQASQHERMAAGLHGVDTAFTEAMDSCLDLFAGQGIELRERWLNADGAALTDTALAQPLLFAVQYSLARMWRSRGVEPAAVVGHSLGEFTAAAVAGVFALPDAVRLVAARAAASDAMPPGGMLAVSASPEELTGLPEGVTVGVVNAPAQTVLTGAVEALGQAEEMVRAKGFTCRVLTTSRAFHSPLMAPAVDLFAAAFTGVRLMAPTVPLYSAALGGPVFAQATDPGFWAGQLAAPVHFDRVLDALLIGERRTVLEVGAGHVLARLTRLHPEVRAGHSTVVTTLPAKANGDDERYALLAAATLWTEGHYIDWTAVRGPEPVRRVPTPGYQYQREPHWLELTAVEQVEPVGVKPTAPVVAAEPITALTWVEQQRATGPKADKGVALALVPVAHDIALPALLALRQAGHRVVVVRPGPEYADSGDEFRARPDSPQDFGRVLDELEVRGQSPDLVVHALGLEPWDRPRTSTVDGQLSLAFHSVAELARCAARSADARLLVLTARSVDVTGAEFVDPVKATLHGAVRTLALEAPELAPRLIDIAPLSADEDLADEIAGGGGDSVVALRGRARWVRVERRYEPPAPAAQAIRRGGVYLLTGGLGGLGLEVARAFAGTGTRPHLVLLGRTGAADPSVISALEAMGATVRVERCDVADRRSMRRVVDTIRAHHGAVHGVVHLAGVAGDGVLLLRDRRDAEEVLRPKVMGTLALEEALVGNPPLDFFVSFSSRAAIDGLVGSADYAAANAFLDAHTGVLAAAGVPALSVNWPAWHTVGMAAVDDPLPVGTIGWYTVLDVDDCPFLDEHRVDSVPVLPGTGHLDLVVRAFRETLAPQGSPVRLSDVVFRRVLAATTPRRVDIAFRPDGAGWRFTVSSLVDGERGQAVEHVTGAVSVEIPARPDTGSADLAALRERIAKPVAEDVDATKSRVFTLGPRWDNVRRVAVEPDDGTERLVDLALPAAFHGDLARHPVHPALLDSATAEARIPGRDAPHLPFGYDSLDLYEDLPAALVSHVRRRPAADGLIVADVDLYAEDGRLLARVVGFTMRKVDGDGFLATAESARRGPVEGIVPEAGAALLLSLLGGRHPHQLAVRPHVDDRPVPLTTAPTAPVAAPAPPPRPRGVSAESRSVVRAPVVEGTTVRDRLAALWSRLLGIAEIRPGDDFFELGGNSLTAVELMSGIREEFGARMSIVAMFDHPTLDALARALTAEGVA